MAPARRSVEPSGVHADDHTTCRQRLPVGAGVPLGGSTIFSITSCVRVSSTVVPRPQVTATLQLSGLTATEDPKGPLSGVADDHLVDDLAGRRIEERGRDG